MYDHVPLTVAPLSVNLIRMCVGRSAVPIPVALESTRCFPRPAALRVEWKPRIPTSTPAADSQVDMGVIEPRRENSLGEGGLKGGAYHEV
jgi:hypothetical protein